MCVCVGFFDWLNGVLQGGVFYVYFLGVNKVYYLGEKLQKSVV